MLIKHCERILYDSLAIQAELVKAQLNTERVKMAAAMLENDTVTKRLEVLRLEAEQQQQCTSHNRTCNIIMLPRVYIQYGPLIEQSNTILACFHPIRVQLSHDS